MSDMKLKAEDLKNIDLETLMNLTADQVQEAVGYKPIPAGIYGVQTGNVSWESTDDGKVYLLIPYTITEVVEVPSVPDMSMDYFGDKLDYTLRMYPAGAGLGWFIPVWKEIVTDAPLRDYPEKLSNLSLVAEISARPDKTNPSRINNNFELVSLA